MIRAADLAWRDSVPFARDFGDIYHSADEAGETRRVFTEPANLCEKAARAAANGAVLRVGELGFGTGLNFAVVACLALRRGCRLHYIGFDSRPLAPADFGAIAVKRRTRLTMYGELQRSYPPLLPGWHRRVLAGGRIWLSLYWGDALIGLGDLIGRQRQPVDAWFLDGFAPDRNPEMWREDLLQLLARFAARGTTVATFSAAGRVRRGLESAGFAMRRVDQRPRKRESLAGVYAGEGLARKKTPDRVAVAGAGIAGAATARHLAERGIAVNVYDPAPAVARGASAIPAMLLHPRLLGDGSGAAAWRAHAYAYSQAWVSRFPGFVESGVLQGCGPNLDRDKLGRIAAAHAGSGIVRRIGRTEALRLSDWDVGDDALHFPRSGIVEPAVLIRSLLDHPRIALRLGPGAPGGTRPLVLACAGAARRFPPARFLETVDVQGQVDFVTMDAPPRLAVVGDGYLAPTGRGVVAGATFEHRAWPDGAATAHNLKALAGRTHRWVARVRATRTIASDRTPIVGELGPGLYVSTAHGSMGTVTAPFAASMLASYVTGDFAPVNTDVAELVAPSRFRRRQARRGFRLGTAEPLSSP